MWKAANIIRATDRLIVRCIKHQRTARLSFTEQRVTSAKVQTMKTLRFTSACLRSSRFKHVTVILLWSADQSTAWYVRLCWFVSGSLLENMALKETPLFNILSAEANLWLFHCCCFCCSCLFKISANKELQVTKLRRTENHAKSSYSSHYSAAHPQKCSQFTLYFNF